MIYILKNYNQGEDIAMMATLIKSVPANHNITVHSAADLYNIWIFKNFDERNIFCENLLFEAKNYFLIKIVSL